MCFGGDCWFSFAFGVGVGPGLHLGPCACSAHTLAQLHTLSSSFYVSDGLLETSTIHVAHIMDLSDRWTANATGNLS